jgi:nitrogen fixation/metabolism regulation signal transduction histidine kinase
VLTVDGAPLQLVALMPVEDELEAEAMQAWQKLVHVLTHEIMNSLTPVASLSHTSRELVKGVRGTIANEVADDLDIALDAIGRRADSLTRVVGGYRQLASVPQALPQRVDLARLCARMEALAGPRWQARGGRASFMVEPESLALLADAGQLEQALMNLLMNAEEATGHLAVPEGRTDLHALLLHQARRQRHRPGDGAPAGTPQRRQRPLRALDRRRSLLRHQHLRNNHGICVVFVFLAT